MSAAVAVTLESPSTSAGVATIPSPAGLNDSGSSNETFVLKAIPRRVFRGTGRIINFPPPKTYFVRLEKGFFVRRVVFRAITGHAFSPKVPSKLAREMIIAQNDEETQEEVSEYESAASEDDASSSSDQSSEESSPETEEDRLISLARYRMLQMGLSMTPLAAQLSATS